MKSIKIKIVSLIFILLLSVCSVLGITSYSQSSKALTSSVRQSLMEVAKESSLLVQNYMEKQWGILETIAVNEKISNPKVSAEAKYDLLQKESNRLGSFINYADVNGDSIAKDKSIVNIKDRPYFQQAIAGNKAITEPMRNKKDGTLLLIYSVPVKWEGKVIGILFQACDGNSLSAITKSIKTGETGYTYIINEAGTVMAHNNEKLLLTNAIENLKTDASWSGIAGFLKKIFAEKEGSASYVFNNKKVFGGYAPIANTKWFAVTSIQNKEILAGLKDLKLGILIYGVLFFILFILLGIIVSNFISTPLVKMTNILDQTAMGDLAVPIPDKILKTKDETGHLAKSVFSMQSSIRELIGTVKAECQNFDSNAEAEEQNIAILLKELEEVSATTQELSASTEETAAFTEEMSSSSSDIMNVLSLIAQKVQDGTNTSDQISRRASELRSSALKSKEVAFEIYNSAEKELHQAIEQSKEVNEINNLSKAILDITEQTNLLALNASIEAAKAGDAGKGFAVVAEEIRKLAETSNQSVSEIQTVTNNVILSVENLSVHASKLLDFISTNVFKDYDSLLDTSQQYDNDSQLVNSFISELNATSNTLEVTITKMIKTLAEIAIAIDESASGTSHIAGKAVVVTEQAGSVLKRSNETKESSENLVKAISKFNI